MHDDRRTERFAALALGAAVLFLPPFLGLFNVDVRVLGVPLVFAYLFAAWMAVIVLAALISRGVRVEQQPAEDARRAEPAASKPRLQPPLS